MDWWQTDVFSEPMQDIWGTTGAQRLMDLSLSNFLQEEQWHGCVVLHAYIVHMFRWRSGFEIYDMPLRCLHISQTTSYHHLISSHKELRWDEVQMVLNHHISSQSKCDRWGYTTISVMPDHVSGVTVITSFKMKLVCSSVLFFFFLLRCPGEPSLFGVPQWSWI